jgi:hypothetical protein
MGADNQAEKVISRIEYRTKLAETFYRAWNKSQDMAYVAWPNTGQSVKSAFIAGITAVLQELEK